MPKTAATAWRASPSRVSFPAALCVLAAFFVIAMVAWRCVPGTGMSAMIDFGSDWQAKRIPQLKEVPITTYADGGYDGQFYAQLAVDPRVTNPDVQHALDNPMYRSRRILLPLLAHALGFGASPATVLNIYAMLNLAAWFALAAWWWREVGPQSPKGAGVWLACMMSLGALDSVRLSLTDLPATLLLIVAAGTATKEKKGHATIWIIIASFMRETSILGAVMLRTTADTVKSERARIWLLRVACILPAVAWGAWLARNVPGDTGTQLFTWPGFGLAQQLYRCMRELAAGNFDSRFLFGLLGPLGLAYQSIYLLMHWRDSDAWTRLGLPFAVMFWLLGAYVFSGYWAAARACLPLTFAFNRIIPRDSWFWPRLVLANLCALHGLWRFLP